MKYLPIFLIMLLCGCFGQETPSFQPENPFVVTEIKTTEQKGICLYNKGHQLAENSSDWCLLCDWYPEIYDSCGKFQIGDTIKLSK